LSFSTYPHFISFVRFLPDLRHANGEHFGEQIFTKKVCIMAVTITKRFPRNKEKTWYHLEWGKAAGQRMAAGIFTYTKPKDPIQKNHNKEALAILETKRSQLILEQQAISTQTQIQTQLFRLLR
jgi:hypothetical protein